MHTIRHQVYATLQGKSLNQEVFEQLPEVSGVGRYLNADDPGIRYPERAQFHLPEVSHTPSAVSDYISGLEKYYATLQRGGVRHIILRWTILSNDHRHQINTEVSAEDLARLASMNASLAITFSAAAKR
ncbi:hypothetical protein CLV84_1560 [Neolewinella xylanilytica]|uniref:Uncharacterized protein n=1 Tax=Neolewinella xylanilytica TaxID=1514080 RepID=A0A2S6IAQ8_9BACT|nr:hypothetical protein [Neolewinella xylanilytica]PPK88591.1 hypothetical protein CLV84_1560 [Neolewinella xylanilytica]